MLKGKLGNIFNRKDIRTVSGNFIYLSILNGLNILLPLITLPYILKIVGEGNYGIYSYVYSVIQIVIIFSTYGFNFSATKLISECRDNKEKVNSIYNAVIASKLLIAILLSLLIFLFSKFVFKDEYS